MKAVVYHTDASISEKFPKDTYKNLLLGLRKNCNDFNIPLVHITINGFEGYGDENIFVDADPENIVWNREKFFIEYLKSADSNETYYFTEPDSRINKNFPDLTTDLALLYRGKVPRITPAWRLARTSALSIFEEVFDDYTDQKTWNTDCTAWDKFYDKLNPVENLGIHEYKNLTIELRDYKKYCLRRRDAYVSQFKSNHKSDLIRQDKKDGTL
jgi:hypothetical protein